MNKKSRLSVNTTALVLLTTPLVTNISVDSAYATNYTLYEVTTNS